MKHPRCRAVGIRDHEVPGSAEFSAGLFVVIKKNPINK